MLNNAKPYFFLNEMNKKDLPAMYSTAFWCSGNAVEYIAGKSFLLNIDHEMS